MRVFAGPSREEVFLPQFLSRSRPSKSGLVSGNSQDKPMSPGMPLSSNRLLSSRQQRKQSIGGTDLVITQRPLSFGSLQSATLRQNSFQRSATGSKSAGGSASSGSGGSAGQVTVRKREESHGLLFDVHLQRQSFVQLPPLSRSVQFEGGFFSFFDRGGMLFPPLSM